MTQYLKQHDVITEARYEMSALEKNILYLLMRELDEQDPPGKQYIVDLATLEQIVGPLTREAITKATDNLISRDFEIKEDENTTLIASLMTVVLRDFSAKKLYIKISQNILPYFVALKKNYTEFELHVALSLRHKYSKRLYEMLSQHKEAGELHISIQELKRRLKLNKDDKHGELYTQFATFRRSILEVAQEELAEHADIHFTYEAIKTGKKYTDLTFYIEQIDPLSHKNGLMLEREKHQKIN